MGLIDFAAAIDQTVAEGRAFAEALMVATCRITEDGAGDPVFNDTTGQYDEPDRVTVYEGKCRIQVRGDRASHEAEAGDREVVTQEPELQLPVAGTEGVAVNHQVEILTNPRDESLVDRVFTVTSRHEKTHATARRLRVTEAVG